MTDPNATADGSDTATTASDTATTANVEQAPPDAAALAKEAADYKDKLLRALADMENLRRRTDREVADARLYGISSLARDIIGVADNLCRALEAAGESAADMEGPAKALIEGVELIERELLKVLERHGVKRFDPHGARFDPNFHQAIFEVSDAGIPPGSIAQVVQPGYLIGERVLRPALVGVSRESPKAATSESPTDEAQTG
jgi:molecular chaperone GrpE